METAIPETHRQDQVVACRMTRHERLLVESLAAREGSILAHFVRSVLLERVRRELSGLRLDRGIGEHRPG